MTYDDETPRVVEASVQKPRVDAFLSGLSHKLRNSLNGVWLHCEVLRRRACPEDRVTAASLEAIVAEVARMSSVITDIGDLGRAQLSQRRITDIGDLMQRAVDGVAEVAAEREIEIRLTRPGEPIRLEVDPDQIRRLIEHLVSNGIDSVERKGWVEVQLVRDGELARLFVRDSGPGFTEGALEHVFEPFYTTKRGGTGLGLAVCAAIAQAHGGKLLVTTNGHATLELDLPG